MSDDDIQFMTQLSNDIARSVGGISAVRHHGLRTKKRKIRNNGAGPHYSKREDKAAMHVGSSKRTQVGWLPAIIKLKKNCILKALDEAVLTGLAGEEG